MSSDSGFWEFHKKVVTGRPGVPCRNVERTEHGKGIRCKTRKDVGEDRETTDLYVMGK